MARQLKTRKYGWWRGESHVACPKEWRISSQTLSSSRCVWGAARFRPNHKAIPPIREREQLSKLLILLLLLFRIIYFNLLLRHAHYSSYTWPYFVEEFHFCPHSHFRASPRIPTFSSFTLPLFSSIRYATLSLSLSPLHVFDSLRFAWN